jgi:hypothetical protein
MIVSLCTSSQQHPGITSLWRIRYLGCASIFERGIEYLRGGDRLSRAWGIRCWCRRAGCQTASVRQCVLLTGIIRLPPNRRKIRYDGTNYINVRMREVLMFMFVQLHLTLNSPDYLNLCDITVSKQAFASCWYTPDHRSMPLLYTCPRSDRDHMPSLESVARKSSTHILHYTA